MFANYDIPLDDQAKWEFIQEVERYHRQLRHIEALTVEPTGDLFRTASQEHLQRVTNIYAQLGVRQQKSGAQNASWWPADGPSQ